MRNRLHRYILAGQEYYNSELTIELRDSFTHIDDNDNELPCDILRVLLSSGLHIEYVFTQAYVEAYVYRDDKLIRNKRVLNSSAYAIDSLEDVLSQADTYDI